MPARPARTPLPRDKVLLLVKHHLEHAATNGLTKQELLASIGPSKTSLQTIQRALADLRDDYDAQLTCSGADRRWRLESPLAMPLDDPDDEDLLAVLAAQAVFEPLALPRLCKRIDRLVEQLDERVRRRASPSELPTRKAFTASLTLGTQIDALLLGRLVVACRRKRVRIYYASPWQPPASAGTWRTIEPWALRMHDGALYLRAWAEDPRGALTFRLADIQKVEDVEDRATPASRHSPPADVWGEESHAFGIDRDRPGVAVILLRGAIARWIAPIKWHPCEQDVWLEPGDLPQRTIPYRSCRELARRLVSVIDGIESIEPKELHEEVVALGTRTATLRRRPAPTSSADSQPKNPRSKSK